MKKRGSAARVVIGGVRPEIDGGRFPIKRTVGEQVVVEADIFADGHDSLVAILLHRKRTRSNWVEVPMAHLGNDRWLGMFIVADLEQYRYTLMAWIDEFATWCQDLKKKIEADQDVAIDLLVGADLIKEASKRSTGRDAKQLKTWAGTLLESQESTHAKGRLTLSVEVAELMAKHPDRRFASTYPRELLVMVEREKARFSAWYEMFPRSCASKPGTHATFKDCEARLPYVAAMGFDVLYFPPIHPIGRTYRKGKNDTPIANQDDPGSPWGIGAEAGGHKTVHPELGTLEDFRHLVVQARAVGIEIALDMAFHCSADHPYMKEHPEWFRWRPDGTVQYAENPPKKYQDIYPLKFENPRWQELWEELKSIVLFWSDQGVRIFRVDNPHTKPFSFWEWLIGEVKKVHPEVIFLSEAFTRPNSMCYLAKLGFSQSYTYFTWRNTKWELTQYFEELTQTKIVEYFRPNLWLNTPDILTDYLQSGGRPAFMARLVLAATLGASYGIYGPAFELCENRPREPGSEEYLDSEKYEIKHWDIDRADSLKEFIARVNRIRRENAALHCNTGLRFYQVDNDQLLCYSKNTEDHTNIILVVVSLDPHCVHSGWIELELEALGLDREYPYQVHDLLSDSRYLWHGSRNYVEINPNIVPAHIFRVNRRLRTERDVDYYM